MLQLPRHFTATHETVGLPGFPAVDVFGKGGTPVCCEFSGLVVKLSGHSPTPTTQPGGPYGWSIYVALRSLGGGRYADVYYLTHFGRRAAWVKVGARVGKGLVVGYVADYAKATGGVTPSHIHEGFHAGAWTP